MKKLELKQLIKEEIGKLLKEYTSIGGDFSNSFQHNAPFEYPGDMFEQNKVEDILPMGFNSRGTFEDRRKDHLEWTKKSQYNNTFVHVQYHNIEFQGKPYRIHQEQYYNHHYDDFRNPKYTKISIVDIEEENNLGNYLMDTDSYIKDLKNLNTTKRVS